VQRKLTSSSWFDDFGAIGNFLLDLRLFLECNVRESTKGLLKEAVEGLEMFWKDSETYFETMVTQLIRNDVEKSNTVTTMEIGTFPALEAEAAQNDEAIDTPPIARTGHFAFALLDLIQQSIGLTSGYVIWVEESIKLGLYVAKTSAHSFLRRKALEVLLSIGQVEGTRLVDIEKELAQITEHRKLAEDWREVKRQGERRVSFQSQRASIVVDSKTRQQVNSFWKFIDLKFDGPIQRSASKLSTLIDQLEEMLVIPNLPSEEQDLFQVLPCGHCQTRMKWSHSSGPVLCSVCSTTILGLGPPLPTGRIGDCLHEMKDECNNLENYQLRIDPHPITPTNLTSVHSGHSSQETLPLTRTSSFESGRKIRFPVFWGDKRPESTRRPSLDSSSSQTSLLRSFNDGPQEHLVKGKTLQFG